MVHADGYQVTRRILEGGIGMKHPKNRAERRHERLRIIAHRRFIRVNGSVSLSRDMRIQEQEWQRYSKWNGNCGSMLCHFEKYFGHKRKRREALKRAGKEEV